MKHLADQPGEYFDMGAGCNFGHHAAERAVRVILPYNRLGEDLPIASDQSGGAIIARRFKCKDQCHFAKPLPETPALR